MKSIIFFGIIAVVTGAPSMQKESESPLFVSQQQLDEFMREAPSGYGVSYVSPCAAAAAANPIRVPVYAAAPAQSYQHPVRHYQTYAAPAPAPHYSYSVPQYRAPDEHEAEMMRFSDMDFMPTQHMPMARLGGYGAVAPALSPVGHVSSSPSGPAIGVFPNANVGGCNVPLLFSCSPNIVSGRMMEAQSASAPAVAAAVNSYRLVDESAHHDAHEQAHEDFLTHEQPTRLKNPVQETSHLTQP